MVVGDMDQSIYGFRGANPQGLANFANDYSGCQTFLLENNYRCTSYIASAAQVIK